MGFPHSGFGKETACNTGDPGSIPESGRSPGGGNGNPLQYSCLENPMDRGALWAAVHGVTRSQTWLVTKPPPPPLLSLPFGSCWFSKTDLPFPEYHTTGIIQCSGFPGGFDGKERACNAGDLGSIPVLGRSPRGEHGNPLQYSCLENPMDRGAWQATVHDVAKSQIWLSD